MASVITTIIKCIHSPLNCVCNIWGWMLDLWLVLKPCRFSLISLTIGFIFFGLAPQGIDILRAMTETGEGNTFSFVLFYACIWLWALSIWYWARHMLSFEHIYKAATNSNNKPRSGRFVEEVPRVLGGLAFLKTGREYPEALQDTFAVDTDFLAYIYFFSGILFYSFAKLRRRIFGKMLRVEKCDALHKDFKKEFGDLPKTARTFVFLLTLITVIAFIWTTVDPVGAGMLGTANLLLIAAANWVFIGTVLVFYGDKRRIPVFIMLLVLAFIFSAWNDNHVMRTQARLTPDTNTRLAIDDHFEQWISPRLARWQKKNKNDKFPLFIVAAEGGGIRAAYWSATLLGAMQDSNPEFASHIYAMSGVSGGSLGIATFAALVKVSADKNAKLDSACLDKDKKLVYQVCAHAMLSKDFLAPVAGRMLYGDLVQRFLPVGFNSFDRARAIELGWESSWQSLTGTNYFSEPLLGLYGKNRAKTNVPALFLNSTWVEEGRRVISSNLIKNDNFITVHDLYAMTDRHIGLSTAVHNSARFSYVSPAGTVIDKDNKIIAHLIDGGYYENSGATTAMEILNTIRKRAGNKRWQQIKPIIMMITNDPNLDDTKIKDPNPYANEVRSPIEGMLNTRDGRGSYSRVALQKTVKQLDREEGVFKEFGLQNIQGPVPLGWMLSDAAMNTMKKRLACYMNEAQHNALLISDKQNCNMINP